MPTPERYRALSEEQRETMREHARSWYRANREKRLEQQRKWREENLELKRKIMRESAQRRRSENPEITREDHRKRKANESPEQRQQRLDTIREWHKAHRAEMLEYWRNYLLDPNHRQKERIRSKNRRAWKKQAVGKFTADDIQAIYERQNGRCAICGVVFPETGKHRFEVDHIIPLKPRGASMPVGTNNPENLQLLCRPCNRSKSNRLP